jgi:hypothetical protein
MGLMRRVESRMENAAGVGPKNGRPGESRRTRSGKGSKLYVRPAELAQKLVKEMEAHKVVQPAGTLVSDRYTVYLCPEDFDRLTKRRDEVVAKLERHLAKHARAKKYAFAGDIAVSLEGDPDLDLGHFGILAERLEEDYGRAPVEGATEDAAAVAAPGRTRSRATVGPTPSRADHGGGSTKIIRPADAAQLGLARHTIVLKAGNRVREFSHGRVIVGRARSADFRVDDPNVSRRHAAIYWADGGLMVEDLDSTNGTMVNGHPVTHCVLSPDDVVVVGDCRITVDTR